MDVNDMAKYALDLLGLGFPITLLIAYSMVSRVPASPLRSLATQLLITCGLAGTFSVEVIREPGQRIHIAALLFTLGVGAFSAIMTLRRLAREGMD